MMNSQERLITIFLRLQYGKRLSKAQLTREFSVNPKTIQRDISTLRRIIEEQHLSNCKIVYDNSDNTYRFLGKTTFNKKYILIISKILLENRALNKSEMDSLLESLLALLSSGEMREVKSIIENEHFNYKSLTNEKDRIETVWFISEAIRSEQMLEIDYTAPLKEKKTHIIFPVSLYYDAHYFYLVAYHKKYEDYTTFRIDRISSYSKSNEKKPNISYGKIYKDGDVRNQKVDAFEGSRVRITLIYKGNSEIILDKFPNHTILSAEKDEIKLQIDTQNTPGLKRWILGQGGEVTVLTPKKLVEELQEILENTLKNYKK